MARYFFPVLGIAVFLAFFKLGAFKLFDVDEAVFAQASNEMVTSGNWITPTYNGVNRYDKPIFIYWLMALSYKAFGVNEFAARFPSAVAAVLLACSIYLFAGASCGEFSFQRPFMKREKRAFYAALSFMLSLYYAAYSHAAVTDMTLSLFISLSLFSFYMHAVCGRRPYYAYGFYLFSALAFLTKGLIGILIPFGVAGIFMLAIKRLAGLKKLWSLPGLIIFLVVSAPWYTAETMANGKEFLYMFFIKHHFLRYTSVISGHSGPVYYYIPVLLLGAFPWAAMALTGARNSVKDADPAGLFALVWASFILVFFSFSRTKLPDYILPAMPAVAILAANGIMYQKEGWTGFANGLAGVLALAGGVALLLLPRFAPAGLPLGWTVWLAIPLLAIALISFAGRNKIHTGLLGALMLVFLVVVLAVALPPANNFLQGTLYKYSIYAKQNLPADGELICYDINNPSVVFYSGRKITGADNTEDLVADLSQPGQAMIITRSKYSGELAKMGLKELQAAPDYVLFEKS